MNKKLAAYQNALTAAHFAEVESMYRQMRGWRHDYKNHISVMKGYAASEEFGALVNYLNQLETGLTAIDTVVRTGNKMADAILNSKISLAISKNVPVSAEAEISTALTTPEIDLCVIIGSLFDNAIEASLLLPEEKRVIRVFMEMKGTQLYMSFTNMTAGKKLNKIFGVFRSTKGAGRGLGLARVDALIKKHGGYLSRNSEDGAFTTEVLLPQ